ncbi:phenylacetate--CoA ligase [Candidatus Dependentiae bacterium]|nr:phenylacetate--CoA ligase [Candidatus Dependentiae bacterium]
MVFEKIEKLEKMSLDEIKSVQLDRLKKHTHYVYEKIPFYKKKFDELKLKPGDIKTLDDIKLLPFTNKTDLRDNYPFSLFAAPPEKVVRIHASSGTTGKPIVVGYTKNDIGVWAESTARTLYKGNVCEKDVIQNGYGYGLFTGGLGIHYGAEYLGIAVIPISGGNTPRQLMIMEDFGSTLLSCTPSYAMLLAEAIEKEGIDRKKLKLRVGYFGAEPWSDNMRIEIEKKLKVDALDIYGLSEIIGPGVASECLAKKGLHICCDHFIPEIINPQTGEQVPEGVFGELVFTTVTKECSPFIRYRTRDIAALTYQKCECGSSHYRMTRVAGRTDDMLIIRGINVFPSQIESVLMKIEGVAPHYQIVITREGSLDEIEVMVEMTESAFSDEMKEVENFSHKIQQAIESVLTIRVKVKLVEPDSIQRFEGKAKRVIDKRKM